MRHFKTLSNANGIYMGQLEIPIKYPPDITDVMSHSELFNSALLLSSPLLRGRQTAEYICNLFPEKNITIVYSDALKERSLGDFEGRIKSELNGDKNYYDEHKQLLLDKTPPGAEPIPVFLERVDSIIPQIQSYLTMNNVIIISHLQVLRALTCKLGFSNISEWYSITYSYGEIIRLH